MTTNRLKLILAWLLVGIPLAWGVFHSVNRSLPLFQGSANPVTSPPLIAELSEGP